MKAKWIMAALCCVALGLTNCEKKGQGTDPGVVPPAPPYLSVSGYVKDEAGLPLDSIQISLEKSDSWWWTERDIYTDNGIYEYLQMCDLYDIVWPTEVTVTAKDPAEIYETQTQTLPVKLTARYPETPELKDYIDGLVTANFVLHKK